MFSCELRLWKLHFIFPSSLFKLPRLIISFSWYPYFPIFLCSLLKYKRSVTSVSFLSVENLTFSINVLQMFSLDMMFSNFGIIYLDVGYFYYPAQSALMIWGLVSFINTRNIWHYLFKYCFFYFLYVVFWKYYQIFVKSLFLLSVSLKLIFILLILLSLCTASW